MRTHQPQYPHLVTRLGLGRLVWLWLALLACCAAGQLYAATTVIYTNDFEAYTDVATSLTDTANANPTGLEWIIADDTALSPTNSGAGVQVVNYMAHSGSKSLLVHSSSEAQVHFRDTRSGTKYTLDFW